MALPRARLSHVVFEPRPNTTHIPLPCHHAAADTNITSKYFSFTFCVFLRERKRPQVATPHVPARALHDRRQHRSRKITLSSRYYAMPRTRGVRGVRGIIQTGNLMHFVYLAPCTLRPSSKPLPSANQNSERGRDRARVLVSVSGFGEFLWQWR